MWPSGVQTFSLIVIVLALYLDVFMYAVCKFCKLFQLCYATRPDSKPIKVNRKVQGVPQAQTAANPRHQEEEKMD